MKEKTTQELLEMLLSRLNIDESNPLMSMHRSWMEIVGPDIAAHAKLFDIRGKVLVIETDHPTWSSLILMRKRQIVARLKAQFPELGISQLQVRSKSNST
jgi:predicted nucleic acid-binding Zn ribbon protein